MKLRAFLLLFVFLLFVLAAACTLPWRDYPVSPPLSGRLERDGVLVTSGRIRLQVRSLDNATLGGHRETALGADGDFAFDEIALRVAGQEYGKAYVLLLYWLDGDAAVTLFRADYPRRRLGGPIALACDLDRAPMEGAPCRFVGDARDQPWLLDAGARDYRELCRSCHGADALGDGPAAAGLRTPPPDLTRIAARRDGVFPSEEIALWLDGRSLAAHGTREMPIWGVRLAEHSVPGGFTGVRIRNRIDILVEYLETIQQP